MISDREDDDREDDDPHKALNIDLERPLDERDTLPVLSHRMVIANENAGTPPSETVQEEVKPKHKHHHKKDKGKKEKKTKDKKKVGVITKTFYQFPSFLPYKCRPRCTNAIHLHIRALAILLQFLS